MWSKSSPRPSCKNEPARFRIFGRQDKKCWLLLTDTTMISRRSFFLPSYILLHRTFTVTSFLYRRNYGYGYVGKHHKALSSELPSSNWIDVGDAVSMVGKARFVDSTWYHKGDKNGRLDFMKGPRIAGAVFFDLASDQFSSPGQQHPQPTVEQFEAMMTQLGIESNETVILYASSPTCFFLPRVWFTFRHLFGHHNTFLLRGTLEDWMEAGGPTDRQERKNQHTSMKDQKAKQRPYEVLEYNPSVLIGLDELKRLVHVDNATQNKGLAVLDARGSSFAKGHIPGAQHVPFRSLHYGVAEKNAFKQPQDLQEVFGATTVHESAEVVLTCGSGVSACSLYLGLSEIGYKGRVRVYDGSWFEWGAQKATPKVLPLD